MIAYSLGLDSSLATDTHRTSLDAKLLVLASQTTFLIAFEFLELFLQSLTSALVLALVV